MLIQAFPKLENTAFVRILRTFFRSPLYPFLIAIAMACSEIFGLELAVFYFYLALGGISLLFMRDSVGVLPIVACSYMTISAINNPGKQGEVATVFSQPSFILQLALVITVAILLFIGKLVIAFIDRPKRGVPRLTLGLAALGLAYVLAGIFSGHYSGRTALYGFIQFVSIALFYFYFYFTIDWEGLDKRYFAFLLTAMGVGLAFQTIGMYFNENVLGAEEIDRSFLFTGWGIHNNVACMVAMCLPGPFYLAVRSKHGWAYNILGNAFFLALLLTQSRGGILFGGIVYLLCAGTVIFKTKGMNRVWNLLVYTSVLVAALICAVALREQLLDMFASLIDSGLNDSSRFDTYRMCWQRFLESPAFGSGFYHTPGTYLGDGFMHTVDHAPETGFIPPRAHDTFFQLLASGGVFAFVAYLFHRIETLISVFRRPTLEKTMIFFSVLALLLTSLLDCNFFNIGPGVVYGILLAIAEGTDKCEKENKPPYWLCKKCDRK